MLGHKDRDSKPLTAVSLDDLVPEDNFYRQVEACLDLRFIREQVCELYSEMGQPSIDRVVFFKLQLIAFFEGIRSERRIMDTVNVNLAHRWFIGYDLSEAVPDHGSLSKIRDRYGLVTFQQFFERILELCIEAGQNLKRLIKHRLEKLCFWAQYLISCLFPTEVSLFATA